MEILTNIENITDARAALPEYVRRTPIIAVAPTINDVGQEKLFVKAECLQITGAYKVRAAFNVIRQLDRTQRSRGIVLASSGNFSQAFAFVAKSIGIPVTIVMLESTSPYKVAATQALGAKIHFCGDASERQPTVERLAQRHDMIPIDTWEDPNIIPGHASIGLEILEDFPNVEQILVPISSGGVASGIATAVKLISPRVRVIGVQPERANAYYVSRDQNKPVTIDYWDSIADGLSARNPGRFPFSHLQKYLDDVVLVKESDIAETFRCLLFRAKLLVEPAGCVAPASFLYDVVDTTKVTVAVATGGNVTADVAEKLLQLSAPNTN